MVHKSLVISLMLTLSATVLADDPATSPVLPNKSGYTLFNPTPTEFLRAQDSDRPDKTNSPHTIDAGHVQIESGIFDFNFQRHSIKDTTISLAQEDFRIGLLNNLEVNAAISLYNSAPQTNFAGQRFRHDGVGDLFLGGKFNFWGNDTNDKPWTTALAIQPQFKIPTANRDIGNGHFEANIGLPFLVNLPQDFHLGLETFISDQRNLADTSSILGWQNTISIDRVFFERYDIYLEYWASITTEDHTKTPQTIDVGVIIAITGSVALDTGINFGLNSASTDYEWVGGITVRF